MTALERFLRYVTYDTQSSETSETTPSTPKQRLLGKALAQELQDLGLEGAHLAENGAVYAWLPATPGREEVPVLALIAHMDTAPRVPSENVQARVVRYEGGDLVLNQEKGIVTTLKDFPDLAGQVGKDLVVTDGTTLLGADDKAGIAEILTAMEHLLAHPERPHGRVALCFTPDEEVGTGADYVDLDKLGADFGYTVDGGPLGGLEYENFNAAEVDVLFHGVNIHPGEGKNKLRNACLMAAQFIAMVPPAESPAHTEGYEGFYHCVGFDGTVERAEISYIIRDHDTAKFEQKKSYLWSAVDLLKKKYGDGVLTLTLKDQYFNMRKMVEPHPQLIDKAMEAMRMAGVEPLVRPIRGGTDGARLSFMGLPCPNLFTGGMNFHGKFEYCSLTTMRKAVQVILNLAQLWAK